MRRAAALLVLVVGCGGSSADAVRQIALADLPCASFDSGTGIWESAPFPPASECATGDAGPLPCCAWIELAGHTELHVEHGLGMAPRSIDAYIAFSEYGVGSTPASGDALRLLAADATTVVFSNHTDQRFYLRVDLR